MTSTALAPTADQPPAALALRPGQLTWTETQIAALAQLGLKDASDGDRAVFLHQCQRTGLDPFARQIYMIGRPEKKSEKRNGQWIDTWTTKWTIQTGIEGYRVNRTRAEQRNGVRGILGRPIFYDHDGRDYTVWVQPQPPAACEITYTVRDGNGDTPYTSVLRFDEYVQLKDGKPIAQWAQKPAHMLEKCTEADVYRKAFPQDFSGITLDDTMPEPDVPPAARQGGRVTAAEITVHRAAQPDDDTGGQPETPPADTANPKLVGVINGHFKRLGYTDDERPQRLQAIGALIGRDIGSASDLTQPEARAIANTLSQCKDRGALIELLVNGDKPDSEEDGTDG